MLRAYNKTTCLLRVLKHVGRAVYVPILALTLVQCSPTTFNPPFNDFEDGAHPANLDGSAPKRDTSKKRLAGTPGHGIGIAFKEDKQAILMELEKQDIQYIVRGDTRTLIVPTDHYFEIDSPTLNELCYPGLNNIVKLLKMERCSKIYIAAFTDNVGSRKRKEMLTQAQAETMLGFLWANHIPLERLYAAGYGEQHSVANNATIHGSAMNRRVEIQWVNDPTAFKAHMWDKMKMKMK